ncbi:hypothetical protein [Thermococcus gammatolerans]|uniref:hypothetical protein n=1 Tax=Thermococcus gammatolerans TaxID=187878 RepID=UPI0006627FCD|nr:hypothetical protein [Thermococcus gammatolerans]
MKLNPPRYGLSLSLKPSDAVAENGKLQSDCGSKKEALLLEVHQIKVSLVALPDKVRRKAPYLSVGPFNPVNECVLPEELFEVFGASLNDHYALKRYSHVFLLYYPFL